MRTWDDRRRRTRRSSRPQSSSYAADADAQGRQAADHQRPRGAGDLAADPPGGDPDRPGQLRGRPRDLARCPGHPGRRLRADAVEHRGRRRHRQLARCGHAARRSTTRRSRRPRSPRRCRTSTPTSRPACSGATASRRSTTRSRPARSSPGASSRSSSTRTRQFQPGLQKRTATGALLGVDAQHQLLYSNSPSNVSPSAYTTNLQLSLTQPLLGSAPLAGSSRPAGRPRGQPGADRDRPAQRRRRRLAVQGRGHGRGPLDRAAVLEPRPAARPALEQRDRPSSWPRRSSSASRPSSKSAAAPSPTSPRPSSGSSSSSSTW